jgi:WD40 repeat protein
MLGGNVLDAQTIRTTVEHAPHSGNVTVVAYGGTAAADGDDAEVVDGAGAGSVADVDAAPAPFFVSGGENGVARVWPQSYAPEQCYVAQLVGQQTTASDDDDDDDDVDDVDDNGGDGRRHRLHCCAASEAGRCMAFGGVDGAVRLWSTAAAGAPPPPPVHCQRIEPHDGAGDAWCCGFSGDGSLIAVGYDDGTARVYDVVSGKVRASLEDFGMESVQCCCFNDDASLLATGGWEGELRVWETGSWECAGTLQGHSAQVRGCDFLGGKSQASAVVASASADCTVRVWRCADEAEIAELRAHTGPVNEVRLFSGGGGGTRAVSASDDMSLILWDVATGSALQTLSGHRAPVASCALHHHGGGGGGGRLLLLSVSWDATVRCWDLDDGAVQAEAIVLPPKAKWGACAVLAPPPAVASAAAADAANADTSIAAVDADADAAPTEAEVPGAGALAPVSVIVCGSTGAAEVRFSQLAGTGFM